METSQLLTQYPLSPRKFWKKMIEKIIILGIFSALVGGTYAVISIAKGDFEAPFSSVLVKASFVAAAALIAFAALYGWYVSYYIKTYFYAHGDDFLTIRKGVFMPTEIHVQYLKMQDVYVDQDILDRMLGIYDVHISSATVTSGIAAHIDGVSKASADGLKTLFLNTIKSRTAGYNTQSGGGMNASMPAGSGQPAAFGAAPQGAEAEPHKVQLAEAISSDQEGYRLSGNWWFGEWVKIAIGSIITPAFLTFFFSNAILDGGVFEGGSSRTIFWIWAGILVIYVVGSVIKLMLWKSNYRYEFTDQYIYMKEGIISISEKNMPYNSIQDVRVHQGIIDRIFGVADVFIENASGGSSSLGMNAKQAASTGVVIEGLDLARARHVSDVLKWIITNRPQMRGI